MHKEYNDRMKIFALETDLDTLTKSFLPDEGGAATRVHHHWLVFFLRLLKSILLSGILIAIAFAAWWWVGLPGFAIIGITATTVTADKAAFRRRQSMRRGSPGAALLFFGAGAAFYALLQRPASVT